MGLRLSGPGAATLSTAFARLVGVQATVSADGALVAGAHNPVDASGGSRTVTLADAPSAGLLVAVSKKDSSANTVTVSVAHLRDGGAGTIVLVGQYEALLLTSKADGTWWPVGDHKTKAYFDATYAAKVHAAQHASGGADPVTPTAIGAIPATESVTLPLDATNSAQIINATGTPGAWTALPTLTGFTDVGSPYNSAKYRKEAGDVVRLRGRLLASGAYTGGTVIFTLPVGYRPPATVLIICRSQTTSSASLQVASNGDVSYTGNITSAQWLQIDGITFSTTA